MQYLSTRGTAPTLDAAGVILAGLATDGGLYVPKSWPQVTPSDLARFSAMPYAELAANILQPFVGDMLTPAELRTHCEEAYASFRHPAIAPLVQIGHDEWVLELFHGPTLAFKDFALQLLGRLLDTLLTRRGENVTVIGATSGDTGSAAIAGCQGRERMRIFILHPKGRVSEVQRRQMTTVPDANVFNIAVEGTFDDCQDIVKTLFGQPDFRDAHRLTAVNSINWARVMAQIVYYFSAALSLGAPGREVAFSVPTGNFGDVYAGYVARQMGLPIHRLMVATNRNDILTRFLNTGTYAMADVAPTLAPSMDIQVASNFERLLFDMHDRDGQAIAQKLTHFRKSRSLTVEPRRLSQTQRLFEGAKVEEADMLATMSQTYRDSGMILDPHTAIGVAAGRKMRRAEGTPLVHLATAHPAKFPDAVHKAIGLKPGLPPHMEDLFARPERYATLANDPMAVRRYIEEQ